MKTYTLRNITFQIQDNDRLKFMADARALYNQVADEVIESLEKDIEEAKKG